MTSVASLLIVLQILLLMAPLLRNESLDDHPTFSLDIDAIDSPPCKYVDFKDIPVYVTTKLFALLLFNVRSCRKNFNEFECVFYEYFKHFSCIALTETWLTQDFADLYSIHGFRSFNVYRTPNGGGIRLYCKDDLDVIFIPEFSYVSDVCEMLTVQVSCNSVKFVLSVVYHPPSSDHGLNYMFIEHYCEKLKLLQTQGHSILACGDYNLNLLNPLNYGFIMEFVANMLEIGLYPIVNISTKYNHENEATKYSILNQVWTTMPNKVSNVCVLPYEITDHFPVFTAFNFCASLNNPSTLKKCAFNNRNNGIFTRLLLTIAITLVNGDMNLSFCNYFSQLWDIYERAFPLTPLKSNDVEGCPWMTTGLRSCIRKKASLYRMYVCGTIIKADYTYYKNRLTTLIRRVKRMYYFNLFQRIGNDSSKIWHQINILLGSQNRVIMDGLKVGTSFISGNEMVDYASSFFVNIANDLTANLQDEVFMLPRGRPNPNSFVFMHTDRHEVSKIIGSLKNKCPDSYKQSPSVFRSCDTAI